MAVARLVVVAVARQVVVAVARQVAEQVVLVEQVVVTM